MNKLFKIAPKQLITVLGACVLTFGLSAQKTSKTYTEKFTVSKDAVLDVNTSYADIEFETWDKDIVEVVALIELEGATDEEAEAYFQRMPIEIMGNSQGVKVSSKSKQKGLFPGGHPNFNLDFNLTELDLSNLVMDMQDIAPFPELMVMPPLPMTKAFKFDYKAYKKDGEVYMKKWQKDFEKSFDKEHQKELEEWGEKMEKRAEELQKRTEKREKLKVKRLEKRTEALEEQREVLEEQRFALSEEREKLHSQRMRLTTADSTHFFSFRTDSIRTGPNTFYFLSEGENKNYKIKKTIKIRLPKSTRIKMDVRHGEVKLAENAKNLNATLSHSSLWASTIDGNETNISVSYSPISVQKWHHGQLKANYSKNVSLAEVVNLQLIAKSSNVTIDKLLGKAFLKNDFGPIVISSLGASFEELDVSLKNAELSVDLSNRPARLYIKGTGSELVTPKGLLLTTTKNGNTSIHKGNYINKTGTTSIIITSDYSDVVLKE